MSIKLIPNFLKEDTYFELRDKLFHWKFPWFFRDKTGDMEDYSNFFFQHTFYEYDNQSSDLFKIVMPILGNLNFKNLIRIKANCYSQRDKEIKTNFHTDSTIPHSVALYSLNTNNGYTLFEDGQKIPSEANQLAIFDGSMKHASVSQTDTNIRVNININLIL
jgi:hypothetical protein